MPYRDCVPMVIVDDATHLVVGVVLDWVNMDGTSQRQVVPAPLPKAMPGVTYYSPGETPEP